MVILPSKFASRIQVLGQSEQYVPRTVTSSFQGGAIQSRSAGLSIAEQKHALLVTGLLLAERNELLKWLADTSSEALPLEYDPTESAVAPLPKKWIIKDYGYRRAIATDDTWYEVNVQLELIPNSYQRNRDTALVITLPTRVPPRLLPIAPATFLLTLEPVTPIDPVDPVDPYTPTDTEPPVVGNTFTAELI